MNKEFIPYEEALALKELGFDEECLGWWSECNKIFPSWGTTNTKVEEYDGVSAPLFQQAFRWFREEHKLVSSIDIEDNEFFITTGGPHEGPYVTYGEAELDCLKKLIEIVKEKEIMKEEITDIEFNSMSWNKLEKVIYFHGDGQGDVSVVSFNEAKEFCSEHDDFEKMTNSEIRDLLYKEVANGNMTEYVWVDTNGKWYKIRWI